jgi:hypothetical protein
LGSRGMVYHAPTPQAGRVTDSDGGGRVRVGGEAKLVVVLGFKRGIQTVTISAVGECAKLKLSTVGECVE